MRPLPVHTYSPPPRHSHAAAVSPYVLGLRRTPGGGYNVCEQRTFGRRRAHSCWRTIAWAFHDSGTLTTCIKILLAHGSATYGTNTLESSCLAELDGAGKRFCARTRSARARAAWRARHVLSVTSNLVACAWTTALPFRLRSAGTEHIFAGGLLHFQFVLVNSQAAAAGGGGGHLPSFRTKPGLLLVMHRQRGDV